jgi:hypothetical protein
MRLPPSYIAAGPAIASRASAPGNGVLWIFSNKGGYDESWSSLIGIITAIVGNVLISFALNMQRYAHIRLDREWQEKERQRKKRCASGTSLSRLADEEGSKNDGLTKYHSPRSSEHIEGQPRELIEASENDPLISQSPSQTQTRPSLGSEDSDSSGQAEVVSQVAVLVGWHYPHDYWRGGQFSRIRLCTCIHCFATWCRCSDIELHNRTFYA